MFLFYFSFVFLFYFIFICYFFSDVLYLYVLIGLKGKVQSLIKAICTKNSQKQ